MAWVTFTEDYNWRASKRGFVQYLAGQTVNVPHRCAAEAVAAGKAAGGKTGAPAGNVPEVGGNLPEESENIPEVPDAAG